MKSTPIELGTKDIGKLLMQYAIPSIIATTASALYSITDSIFIGNGVGALAISGLAITFPLMNLSAALGTMVGVGASAILSMRLGQKDYDSANKIVGNVFLLILILGVLFTIPVLIFLRPILYFFGASSDTLPYAYDFMQIIVSGTIITHLYFSFNALIRASGQPMKSMTATILTVVINAILNPLFIFGFGWGMRGSAFATIISQVIVLIWQLHFFQQKDNFLNIRKSTLRLDRKIAFDSIAIGISPFLMNAVSSVIVIIINHELLIYGGDLAVGAFGIVNRVAMLFVMVVFGLNHGMQPIAGYNYGAKLYPRVLEVLKKSIIIATVVMSVGFVVAQLFPYQIASIFSNDQELVTKSEIGIRIVFMFYPLIGFQIVVSTFFQSIGKAGKAIFLSLTRQVIFLIPFLLILPKYFGINGVWFAMPASDALSIILSFILIRLQIKAFRKEF
ncbi:multidrug transporter MatE [Porphyromonadaceae bacterium COT-184 OH4590]|nr:multidrug transporter MatE [Porphyromonadaceae bacterium COT-184 OH4590]